MFPIVLEEQVAVGLYHILTGSCFSQTLPISSISYKTHQQYLNIFRNKDLSCLVVYPLVLYHILTRADTAKYDRFNPALLACIFINQYITLILIIILFV